MSSIVFGEALSGDVPHSDTVQSTEEDTQEIGAWQAADKV